jgi:formyl-CoA transferase
MLKQRDYSPRARGSLAGVRIVDLSRLFAGNLLTQILGDFGAEVIKVEPPGGDTLRAWKTNGVAADWKIYARNKKSLCLELRKPESVEILRKLACSAPMLVESFRPGTLEAMGLGPQRLLKANPKLVIVRISGWGQSGPYRRRPGFGTLIEGMSGFAAINGFADREPCLPPMYLADAVAGAFGASAAMIALREAEKRKGRGQVIDLTLLDPLFTVLGPQAANYRLTGRVRPRQPLEQHRAAQRLPVQGQEVRRIVGVDTADGRAHLSRHRAARADRRSSLQD